MIHKVLIGYDGSEAAKKAVEFGLDLARKYAADIYVLAVASVPEFGGMVESEALIEQSRHHCEHSLQMLKAKLSGELLAITYEVDIGSPAVRLVMYAERHGIDHIVVGHRGHTLFERWLLGSVAKQVMAYAACSVTVVRG
jgi:nucleotide-binding universal stress UspA family protein